MGCGASLAGKAGLTKPADPSLRTPGLSEKEAERLGTSWTQLGPVGQQALDESQDRWVKHLLSLSAAEEGDIDPRDKIASHLPPRTAPCLAYVARAAGAALDSWRNLKPTVRQVGRMHLDILGYDSDDRKYDPFRDAVLLLLKDRADSTGTEIPEAQRLAWITFFKYVAEEMKRGRGEEMDARALARTSEIDGMQRDGTFRRDILGNIIPRVVIAVPAAAEASPDAGDPASPPIPSSNDPSGVADAEDGVAFHPCLHCDPLPKPVPRGERLFVKGKKRRWLHVHWPGCPRVPRNGWVETRHTEPAPPEEKEEGAGAVGPANGSPGAEPAKDSAAPAEPAEILGSAEEPVYSAAFSRPVPIPGLPPHHQQKAVLPIADGWFLLSAAQYTDSVYCVMHQGRPPEDLLVASLDTAQLATGGEVHSIALSPRAEELGFRLTLVAGLGRTVILPGRACPRPPPPRARAGASARPRGVGCMFPGMMMGPSNPPPPVPPLAPAPPAGTRPNRGGGRRPPSPLATDGPQSPSAAEAGPTGPLAPVAPGEPPAGVRSPRPSPSPSPSPPSRFPPAGPPPLPPAAGPTAGSQDKISADNGKNGGGVVPADGAATTTGGSEA